MARASNMEVVGTAAAAAAAQRFLLRVPVCSLRAPCLAALPRRLPLLWIEPSVYVKCCRRLQEAYPRASAPSPIRQTGTAGVILLRMDVVIVQLDVHLASRLARSTRGLERQWGGSFGSKRGGSECLFLALEKRQSSTISLLFPPHNNNKHGKQWM